MEGTTKASAEQIERELEELLDKELFEPPAEFRENALISDESIYEEAANDPEGYWAKQSEELLDWAEPWDAVLDESEAPFYKWFVGGKITPHTRRSTATWTPATATAWRSTGAGRRARSAT